MHQLWPRSILPPPSASGSTPDHHNLKMEVARAVGASRIGSKTSTVAASDEQRLKRMPWMLALNLHRRRR